MKRDAIANALIANDRALLKDVAEQAAEGWPEPIPLTSSTPLSFPAGLVPEPVGEFTEALSAHTETPRELAALMCTAVASAAVVGRYEVEIHPGYTEPLNLFIAAVLEPGNRKTAVVNQARRPLLEFEQKEMERLEPERRKALSRRKLQEARIERLRKQAVNDPHDRLQPQLQALEESLVIVPEPPRLWTQDVTPEGLAALTAKNGERMAVLSDEGGYFDILGGRYSRGMPNLDLVLQGHAGAPVRVDRKTGKPLLLDRPLLTIGLSPQPVVLIGLAEVPAFRGRGLLARFLFGVPRSNLGYRTLDPRPIPEGLYNGYRDCIHRLLTMPPRLDQGGRHVPIKLTLAPDAYESWRDFQRMVEREMREGNRLANLKDWAGKLPGAAARIAGVFHSIAHDPTCASVLSLNAMERALTMASILIPHAITAFSLMSSTANADLASRVVRWATEKGAQALTAREIFCAFQSTFKDDGPVRANPQAPNRTPLCSCGRCADWGPPKSNRTLQSRDL